MEIQIRTPMDNQQFEFAELRARSMRDSLVAINRFDETRVRDRVLREYNKDQTKSIYCNGRLAGFYSIAPKVDCQYIVHFYIEPDLQCLGIGSIVMSKIIIEYSESILRLNALKGSRSNQFYQKHGFKLINQDEFDMYYELNSSQ
jgi:GNAT superfamily N-acetyltransferase